MSKPLSMRSIGNRNEIQANMRMIRKELPELERIARAFLADARRFRASCVRTQRQRFGRRLDLSYRKRNAESSEQAA